MTLNATNEIAVTTFLYRVIFVFISDVNRRCWNKSVYLN
ncbi:hypothetical protein [Candidatus Doolittlea endobia]